MLDCTTALGSLRLLGASGVAHHAGHLTRDLVPEKPHPGDTPTKSEREREQKRREKKKQREREREKKKK